MFIFHTNLLYLFFYITQKNSFIFFCYNSCRIYFKYRNKIYYGCSDLTQSSMFLRKVWPISYEKPPQHPLIPTLSSKEHTNLLYKNKLLRDIHFFDLALQLCNSKIAIIVSDQEIQSILIQHGFYMYKTTHMNAVALTNMSRKNMMRMFDTCFKVGIKIVRTLTNDINDDDLEILLQAFELVLKTFPRDWSKKYEQLPSSYLKPIGKHDPTYVTNYVKQYDCTKCKCNSIRDLPSHILHGNHCGWLRNHILDDKCLPCKELTRRFLLGVDLWENLSNHVTQKVWTV